MRDIVIQLQEEAEDLGFSTIQEAKDAGYEEDINYENGIARLVIDREQEEAHEAWLKEKEKVLRDIKNTQELVSHLASYESDILSTLEKAKDFIEKGEC